MSNNKTTESQKQAIDCSGKTILKSCPGSGKTFVVASKMIKEIGKWKYKNSGIALLSFTNVAHEEVLRQINELSSIKKIDYPHYTGTIDGFISQFLFLPFGHLIMNCCDRPMLLEDHSIKATQLANYIWKKECYKNRCNFLDFYKDEKGIVRHINDNKNCPITYRKPCESLKNSLYSKGLGTYQDATIIALRLLKEYPNIGRLLAKKFPMLIIDEAQDTSKHQMEIIDLLASYGTKDVMLIGDPDQAIYEWRNADPSVFLDKCNDANWNYKELNDNFRCSQKICNVTKIFSTLKNVSTSSGKSATSSFQPQIVRYNSSDKDSIINYFLSLCRENSIMITPENVAVLVRGKAGLYGKDYSQIENLWKSEETRLFSEACYERDHKSLKKALDLVERGLFIFFIDDTHTYSNTYDRENSIKKIISLDTWKYLTHEFCKSIPSSDTELSIWKLKLDKYILDISQKYNLKILEKAMIKIKTRDSNHPDFLSQPIKNFYAKNFHYEYLNSTIHAVKGRSFDAVLLLLQSRGKLTSKVVNSEPIETEEIRTAYVAMTRAKQILLVAVPKTVSAKSLVRFPTTDWDIIDL